MTVNGDGSPLPGTQKGTRQLFLKAWRFHSADSGWTRLFDPKGV
jgi:hypothetical protein